MTQEAPSSPADSGAIIYLYDAARGDAAKPPVEGATPGAAELLPADGLAAVLTEAAAIDGEDTAGSSLWSFEQALSRHRVAPMTFGAICNDLPDAVELFTRSGVRFKRALDLAADASEWGVKLYADIDVCRAMTEWAPAIAPLKAELAKASPSNASVIRKKLHDAIEQEVRRRVAARAESLHDELTASAREVASGRPWQRPGKTSDGRMLMLIAEAAYLVEKQGEAQFRQTVTRHAETLSAEGVLLELTGPWPPYSFANLNADVQRG
jgi:hypothetical protein